MIFKHFPSQWLVFILSTVSLEEQKVFFFRKYNLSICSFVDCGIDFLSIKFLPNPGSQGLSLVFSGIVFVFMFRFIKYLELSLYMVLCVNHTLWLCIWLSTSPNTIC